ncbi:MAG: ATP-binding protein [Balneolaceae bacterium]
MLDGSKIISFLDLSVQDVTLLSIVILITLLLSYYFFSRRATRRQNSFLLNSLIHEQDQYIIFFDFDSKIVLANKRFEDLVGIPSKKMIGKKLDEISVSPEIVETFTNHNDDLSSGKSSSIIYNSSFLKENDSKEWFQIQKRILSVEKSKIKYILTEATDFSDRKLVEDRLTDTRNEYEQLVESANDIIFKVDLKGNFNFVNSIVKEILGYSELEFLSMNFNDLVVEEDFARVLEFYKIQVQTNRPSTYIEFRVNTKSGEVKWLGQSVTFIKQKGEVIGFQAVTRDITASKEAESHLKRAKEIAEETSKTKTGFIASMSHEFRTPLNAILGYAQILGQSNSLKETEKGHIHTISDAGEQLLGMVTDILELSTLDSERSKLDTELVALQPFMKDLALQYTKKAKEEGLKFEYSSNGDIAEIVELDLDKVTSIIKNLLSNAVKFTPKGAVGLSFSTTNNQGRDYLQIEVKDTGIGISEDTLKNIYQPFWQLDSLKNNGTGLGLTLCKRLIEFLDGSIELKSKLGKGTIVKVSIPIKISDQKEHQNLGSIKSFGEPTVEKKEIIKVLIVDDVEANRTITRLILRENGFEFKEAENGLEALNLLDSFAPDVILMDIDMPVMDGLEAMLTIRASGNRFADMPIIAVTAGGFKGDRNELMGQGFSEYILKPFKSEDLLSSINELLNQNETTVSEVEPQENITPESIAAFIDGLEASKKEIIKSALKMQDLDSISKLSDSPNFEEEVLNPNMKALIKAALDYDYLIVTKLLKTLQKVEETKA